MAVRQAGGADDLVRVSVQVTRAQLEWLQAFARDIGVRSVPAAIRVMLQQEITRDRRAS